MAEGEPVSLLREVYFRTSGSVGRYREKQAGELIKLRFADVMRRQPPAIDDSMVCREYTLNQPLH